MVSCEQWPLLHEIWVVDMKILFVLPNIAIGGVERVRLTLIEHLASHGIECRLALRRCQGGLVERARRLTAVDDLASHGLHQFVPSLVKLIRRERPTHVITAFPDIGLLTWLAMRIAGSRAKWVHSVHDTQAMVASRPDRSERFRYLIESRIAAFCYRRADVVATVSEGIRREILDKYAVASSKVVTLHNPVIPDDLLGWKRSLLKKDGNPYRIVALGRLVHQKGFDILIRAMANVPGSWELDIWGDGVEHSRLSALAGELGLQGKVRFCGSTMEPFDVMREADLFVLPSRHEGLPGVLIEAVACQCQIVATDCLQGPREILQNGKLGELVPVEDAHALAVAITRVLDGRHHVAPGLLLERAYDFTRSVCCGRWESLLRGLAG